MADSSENLDKFKIFSPRSWSSTSAWAAKEMHLLNVINAAQDDILDPDIKIDDEKLSKLLEQFPMDLANARKALDPMEFVSEHGIQMYLFYEAMLNVTRTDNQTAEAESFLNCTMTELADYIKVVGSAMPLSSKRPDSSSSDESTAAGIGSSPRMRSCNQAIAAVNPTTEHRMTLRSETDGSTGSRGMTDPTTMPKSISASSELSAQSNDMGAKEQATSAALSKLLEVVLIPTFIRNLRLIVESASLRVQFGAIDGPRSINDGAVGLAHGLTNRNDCPLVNIECKSRKGASGASIMSKIFAQEFGESLAIVQHRRARMICRPVAHDSTAWRTVYSIAMHGRRAYLVRADFTEDYLAGIDEYNIDGLSVTVTRTRHRYRLDKLAELRTFITLLFRLFTQLEVQVVAGRRL